ncbi:GTP-binding protein HSR1-like protein [Methyloglobulus morosus KoM1]|uniref:GTP-binding protein HSR1-like protein n=1 Tax=Methyloglobulus morosus KoM1 TaxID=1116472 RepID=V5BSX8_9GAMM|nr:GTPase [Methyloglobulus morosus]ESS67658.1 GTP-binding protein HSR1-like protein [Methyloglobulus morosus KoM1]
MPIQPTRFSIILGLLLLLPWLAIMALGVRWLWEHGLLFYGLGVLTASFLLLINLLRWRIKKTKALVFEPMAIPPNPNWPDTAQPAWAAIEQLAKAWSNRTDLFTDQGTLLKMSNEVLITVARQFHADSKHPIMEFPLPYLLKLIMLVCEDIQHEVLDKIPGSHAVSVGDLIRYKKWYDKVSTLKETLDAGYFFINWPGAALGKVRSALLGKGLNLVTDELRFRLANAYIHKLGYYAIQLYSGQLTLDAIEPTETLTRYAQQDRDQAERVAKSVEPLRILILGQVSAGKSSLINALFGETKSAEGLLPTTPEITPYVLERDGLQQAIVLDSPGYGGLKHDKVPLALKQEWAKVDVILMVCNAAQAARQADVEELDAIQRYFREERQNQALPVILAVATQIDRLRPVREWQPPYNIQDPKRPKEHSIHQACEAIAQDLTLPIEHIVPVCMASEHTAYNIEEGLIPLIYDQLNEAHRVRYLRCLRHQQDISYWQHWRQQAIQAGQLILKLGMKP